MNKAFKRYRKTAFKKTRYYRFNFERLIKRIRAEQALIIGIGQIKRIKCAPASDKESQLKKQLALISAVSCTMQAVRTALML